MSHTYKLKAIMKRCDRKDAYTTAVSDSLENLQRIVGVTLKRSRSIGKRRATRESS